MSRLWDHEAGLIAIVGIGFAYPVFMRVFASLTAPSRRQLLTLGDDLLGSGELPAEQRQFVELSIERAFDWNFLAIVSAELPVIAFLWITRRRQKQWREISNQSLRIKFDDFVTCFVRVRVAANPLFAAVLALECAVLMFILVPTGLLKQAVEIFMSTALEVEASMQKRSSSMHKHSTSKI